MSKWDGGAITVGSTYEVRFPFIRGTVDLIDDEGTYTQSTWKPGVKYVHGGSDGGDVNAFADAEGSMLLHVVDIHKPGSYPTRVFFTRMWRDPEGKEFGRKGLRIMTAQEFKRRLKGYMRNYEIAASEPALENMREVGL